MSEGVDSVECFERRARADWGMVYSTSDMWNSALDALPKESELVTVEEKLAYAQVLATLSISQELSLLNTGESTLGRAVVEAMPKRVSAIQEAPVRVR